MAMNKTTLGTALANLFIPDDATEETKTMVKSNWINIADVIIEHIKDNAEVKATIPSGTYIQTVSGGSGAPAVGVSNVASTTISGEITG